MASWSGEGEGWQRPGSCWLLCGSGAYAHALHSKLHSLVAAGAVTAELQVGGEVLATGVPPTQLAAPHPLGRATCTPVTHKQPVAWPARRPGPRVGKNIQGIALIQLNQSKMGRHVY
jgi:hypothetical protein